MLKARLAKELIIRTTNRLGALADIAKLLADKGINLHSVAAWVDRTDAVIHLLADDNLRAADALRNARFPVKEAEVVITEPMHKPGMLRHVTERLASHGVELHYAYATAPAGQDQSLLVLSCTSNERAMVLLNA